MLRLNLFFKPGLTCIRMGIGLHTKASVLPSICFLDPTGFSFLPSFPSNLLLIRQDLLFFDIIIS